MGTMEVDITTFVTPHFIFVTDKLNPKKEFLRKISESIKNERVDTSKEYFEFNEIIGVCYRNEFVRAKIEDIQFVCNKKIYYCWLLDYGFLIKCDTVFKVPHDVKEYEPLAKQVLLNNIAYLTETLELGSIKYIPTTVPRVRVSKYCLDLMSGYTNIRLKVLSYYGEIIIGELFIHKNNNVFNLSEELIKQNLLIRDPAIFENLKVQARCYMRNNLNLVYYSGRNFPVCIKKVQEYNDICEENVIKRMLENGRRRFKTVDAVNQQKTNVNKIFNEDIDKSGSDKDTPSNCVQDIATNNPRFLKLRQKLLNTNTTPKSIPYKIEPVHGFKERLNIDILKQKIADIKRQDHKASLHSLTESSSHVSDAGLSQGTSYSPFSDVTSHGKSNYNIPFFPTGMQNIPKNKSKSLSGSSNTSFSRTSHSDCPTIEVMKKSPIGGCSDRQVKTSDSSSWTSEIELTMTTKNECYKIMSDMCKCGNCRTTFEEYDWESAPSKSAENTKISTVKFTRGPIVKPSKLLRDVSEEDTKGKAHIISLNYDMSTTEKLGTNKLLVHGKSIPRPIKRISDIDLDRDIFYTIRYLNYKEVKKIQQYSCPALTKGQHVFMINNTNTGKTMAYLPIMLSFIKEKNETYTPLLKLSGGPIVVILCSNSRKCQEIYDLSRLIMGRHRCRVTFVTYPGHGNISNVDILITTPPILSSLVLSRAVNFKRLCHFVLEDGDKTLSAHKDLIDKFLLYADQVLENRNCPKSIQVVVCAEHWTLEVEDVLKRLNKIPLVCIANYLEAALYGKMNFTMKFLEAKRKNEVLKDILADVFMYSKTMVLCNSDDISSIEKYLVSQGIGYFTIKDGMSQEDIHFYEDEWRNCPPGMSSVLICSDNAYNLMSITNVSILIHYSLTKTWTQFVKRFSCLLKNIASPINTKQKGTQVNSFVFIDENCESKMSKFSQFIKNSCLEKYLPETVKSYFEDLIARDEENKLKRSVELCNKLKLFGRCSSVQCLNRHIISKDADISDFLPKNGYLKFEIICLTDTTTASIKLLEHLDLNGKTVQVFEDLTDQINDILQKYTKYAPVKDLKTSDLYLYKSDNEYFRCKLIEIQLHRNLLFLLDKGIYTRVDFSQMFEMPEELKKIPQQCFEVFFANLVPPYDDTTFSMLSKSKAEHLVDKNCSAVVMKGLIKLQLADNFWLTDVYEEREMFDKSLPSIGFQLTREMIKKGLVVHKPDIIKKLYTVIEAAGIELPQYVNTTTPSKPVVKEQIKPQWAFLDPDEISEVMFSCAVNPGQFYVRNAKFHSELLNLENFILKEIQRPFYPMITSIVVGKYYLAEDQDTKTYYRVLLLKEDNDQAQVFSVDYGDTSLIKSSHLIFLRNDMISRLPFQAIRCSLYGVQPLEPNEWGEEAIDLLYDRGFEPGTDIFRALYMKVVSKSADSEIEGQKSYYVIVKDGYSDKKVLLNTLLIDCGFAISDGNTITDFDMDTVHTVDDDEVQTTDEDASDNMKISSSIFNDDFIGNLEEFEIMVANNDMGKFLKDLNSYTPGTLKQIETCDTTNKRIDSNLPVIKASPAVDFFTPEVAWSQTNSHVKMTIKIQDVERCVLKLLGNKIFYFSTEKNKKNYRIQLTLFDVVEKTFQHTILGLEVKVTFTKCRDVEWPRLVVSTEKNTKIRYDLSKIKDDEVVKRFLDLGLDESSESDNDGPVYHFCSDMDSEYDYDIPNDYDI